MADVFPRALRAVGQAHRVAMQLEQVAVETWLPLTKCSVRSEGLMASKHMFMSGQGAMPRTRSARPFAESAIAKPVERVARTRSFASSKYMSLTMRR